MSTFNTLLELTYSRHSCKLKERYVWNTIKNKQLKKKIKLKFFWEFPILWNISCTFIKNYNNKIFQIVHEHKQFSIIKEISMCTNIFLRRAESGV